MRNPIFKAQVEALFKKTAFFQDPHAVAETVAPKLYGQIHRGLGIERGLSDAAAESDRLLHSGANLAGNVLTSGSALGARALGGVSNFIAAHPKAAIGTAALAPILAKAFNETQHRNEDELMNAYRDPSRVITASLGDFLETKAAASSSAPFHMGTEMLKGMAGGLGGSLVALLAHTLGSSAMNAKNVMVNEPRRHALLENLFQSDPVIKDALARHPDSKTMLLEAYGTMVKFAPSLSLDINATRSFLREAVLGGSGVNYATIKNIVDTEKSISEAKPNFASFMGKGKH